MVFCLCIGFWKRKHPEGGEGAEGQKGHHGPLWWDGWKREERKREGGEEVGEDEGGCNKSLQRTRVTWVQGFGKGPGSGFF